MAENATKEKQAVKYYDMDKLFQEFEIRESGKGTPFWTAVTSKQSKGKAVITLNKDKETVRLVLTHGDRTVTLNMGTRYDEIQENYSDFDGTEIDVIVAPNVPNPSLTDEDIEAVRSTYDDGDRRVSKVVAARKLIAEGKSPAELVLLYFTPPE